MEPFERAALATLMAMGCIGLFFLEIWAGAIGLSLIIVTIGLVEDDYVGFDDFDEDFEF